LCLIIYVANLLMNEIDVWMCENEEKLSTSWQRQQQQPKQSWDRSKERHVLEARNMCANLYINAQIEYIKWYYTRKERANELRDSLIPNSSHAKLLQCSQTLIRCRLGNFSFLFNAFEQLVFFYIFIFLL
jgi:hypothetical protein